jgi:small subunit ribosomal protein S1
MVDYNLISELDVSDTEAEQMIASAIDETGDLADLLKEDAKEFKPGTILVGKIIGFSGDDVVVEVGLKSEGLIPKVRVPEPQ